MVALISSTSLRSSEPRWATARTPTRKTFGPRLAAVAEKLGQPMMPWQRMVADVGGEMVRDEETGFWVPAYPEVMITVPRQSGKTTEVLTWTIDRSVMWEAFDGRRQVSVYTAQSGVDARNKFRDDWVPVVESSKFEPLIRKTGLSAEHMGWRFHNKSIVSILNSSKTSGHGPTVDLGILDEIFADVDDRREQAVIPSMATRHDAQTLITSTAGTDESTVFNDKQAKGRQIVDSGDRDRGMAYFEWSADPDDDPEDPATWASCMPALGYTITERTVVAALERMRKKSGDITEFKRAWLNIPALSSASAPIPDAVWQRNEKDATLSPPPVFGIDSTPDQRWGSIVAADGKLACQLIDHREGVLWLKDQAKSLIQQYGGKVAIDVSGPVGHLAATLEAEGIEVEKFTAQRLGHACGFTLAQIADGQLSVIAHPDFTSAVKGAVKVPMGDAWRWGRKTAEVDVSPLIALTLAVGCHATAEASMDFWFGWG